MPRWRERSPSQLFQPRDGLHLRRGRDDHPRPVSCQRHRSKGGNPPPRHGTLRSARHPPLRSDRRPGLPASQRAGRTGRLHDHRGGGVLRVHPQLGQGDDRHLPRRLNHGPMRHHPSPRGSRRAPLLDVRSRLVRHGSQPAGERIGHRRGGIVQQFERPKAVSDLLGRRIFLEEVVRKVLPKEEGGRRGGGGGGRRKGGEEGVVRRK
mmetsp:Transcript_21135/g.61478  ORF Transcript_21135/g.61478 Transcript_21135/m.61478 type:complete len:207 (-) Transcript_21135:271-891(-)